MTKPLSLLAFSIFTFLASFAQPVIQSFSPKSGATNSSVTITGTGFSNVTTDNIVYFGGAKATVTASTATTITASVPAGATYQPITVTTNNLTAYSALSFLVSNGGSGAGLPYSATSFVPKQDFTTGRYPHGLAVADFNLDGKPDLLVSKGSSGTVSVLTNTTTGSTLSFGASLEVAAESNGHEAPATGDLDGDGKLDIVVPNNWNVSSVTVLRNTTAGSTISFGSRIDLPIASASYAVAIGDLDGDGKPDIAAVNSGTGINLVSVFRNTSTPGNLSFAPRVDLSGGLGPFSIAIADLDADGKSEIVVTGQYSSSSHLSVLKNNSTAGNISFQAPLQLAIVNGPFSVAVGDLNGDDKPDVVAASAFSNAIVVKRNTSTPGVLSFSGTLDYFTTGNYTEGVAITDFDGDAKPDVVATNNSDNSVSVLRNTGTAGNISFASHIDYAVGKYPNYVTCGDLDGDGRMDIIAANTSEEYVSVLRNIIGANIAPVINSFTPGTAVNGTTVTITGSNFTGVTAVKFGGVNAASFTVNSNTSITAIVGPGASGEVSVTNPYGTSVLSGFVFNGPIINSFTPVIGVAGTVVTITGTNFTGATTVMFGGVPTTNFSVNSSTTIYATVGNGANGDVSVTTANGTATRPGFSFGVPAITNFTPTAAAVGATVTITGTNFSATASDNTVFFGAVKATVSSASPTQLSVIVPAGATYAPITVTSNHLTGYSSMPFNTTFTTSNPQLSTTSFVPAGDYVTGAYPWAVYSCDLTDDGKPELITANSVGNSISIFKNASSVGNVSFENSVNLSVGNDAKHIAFGDLDGDGKQDLAVINFNQGLKSTLSVFRNNSTGGNLSFAPKTDIPTGDGSLSLAIADLNGDGKPDVVVTSGNSGYVSILQNTTVGTAIAFAPAFNLTLLSHADEVAVADFDKDGRVDLIVSNWSGSSLSVFRNVSTGGNLLLTQLPDITTGIYPGQLSAGDMDMDGKPDLLLNYNGAVSYLRNMSSPGNISFVNLQNFNFSVRNTNLGDLNGDGKPDLIAGLSRSGKISIFENTTPAPASITFGTNVDFATGSYDTYAAVGDLDGDGKPELVAANTNPYKITILRNSIDAPVITQFSPVIAHKGEVVSFTGSGFTSASVVTFGGTTAMSFTVVSPTRIDAVVDGGASGNVSVTTPAGTGSMSGFKFMPEITYNGTSIICNNSSVIFTSTAAANNQWYKNGALINGATGTTYQATTGGTYTVTTRNAGITTTSPVSVVVNQITVPTPTITFSSGVLTSNAVTGNQWFLNGTLIPNATAQTYQPAVAGNYTVQVTSGVCTSDFSTPYNYIATPISGQNLVLAPNPVRNVLTIQWDPVLGQTLAVEITDMYGMPVIFKQSISSGGTFNVAGLPTGTYFIKLYGAGKKPVSIQKILKVN
ncbi:MAG: beta strand repeat-containing protein [Niastella sp.]|uniref:beta strand repeat-containing protein n=1 Tax=Niastella sp. TaxID=1869183 RepID=UPI003899D490